MNSSELQILFQKYLDRSISEPEYEQLSAAAHEQSETDWEEAVVPIIEGTAGDEEFNLQEWRDTIGYILSHDQQQPAPVYHIKSRKNWIPYPTSLTLRWASVAAAAVIVIAVSVYLWNPVPHERTASTSSTEALAEVDKDVAPGGNKAVLTLADGSTIVLDSASSGQLAKEANATITKTGDGRVEYRADDKAGSKVYYNTMSTPRGGQYQLKLPDGTQVWLNAESSITYPTAFAGNERRVRITGEAYFEVAKDRNKPFFVVCHPSPAEAEGEGGPGQRREGSAQESLTIEVLGTHFNVNTYKDEATYNTTLLEGSVKITAGKAKSITLKPGQQGQLHPTTNELSLAVNPNLDQVMAWKNGLFDFNNKTLEESLHQLARWYDVEVVFEGRKPPIKLAGTIGRSLTLTQVLKGLSAMGLKSRLDASARKLVILE